MARNRVMCVFSMVVDRWAGALDLFLEHGLHGHTDVCLSICLSIVCHMSITLGELEIHKDSGQPTSSLNNISADLFTICRYSNIAFDSSFLFSHVLNRKESKRGHIVR